MKKIVGVFAVLAVLALSGCAGQQYSYEERKLGNQVGGAAIGAGIGQLIGRDTESTLIGTAIGGFIGTVVDGQINPTPRIKVPTHRQNNGYYQRQQPIYTPPPVPPRNNGYYQGSQGYGQGNCRHVKRFGWINGRRVVTGYDTVCEGTTPWYPPPVN